MAPFIQSAPIWAVVLAVAIAAIVITAFIFTPKLREWWEDRKIKRYLQRRQKHEE